MVGHKPQGRLSPETEVEIIFTGLLGQDDTMSLHQGLRMPDSIGRSRLKDYLQGLSRLLRVSYRQFLLVGSGEMFVFVNLSKGILKNRLEGQLYLALPYVFVVTAVQTVSLLAKISAYGNISLIAVGVL